MLLAGARNSLRLSTGRAQSVWDFDSSPVLDQFQGFSMANKDRTPVITPTHGRFPSGALDDSPRHSRRRNNSSIASGHRRGVSFDPLREQPDETGEKTDAPPPHQTQEGKVSV